MPVTLVVGCEVTWLETSGCLDDSEVWVDRTVTGAEWKPF